MLYLTGARSPIVAPHLAQGRIGLLNTPASRYRIDADVRVWAMDNGCFTGTYPGDDAYLRALARYADHAESCLFAAAPDVVGDAEQTLDRSEPMLDPIRAQGYRVALVAQDGMEDMPLPWDRFDAIFVGGSTEWKLGFGALTLIEEALRLSKWVHVGRVNSERRYRYFAEVGCHSCDGTFLAFGPDTNTPKLLRWLSRADRQQQSVLDLTRHL